MSKFNNAPMSWFELLVPSAEAANDFYRNLFGWNFEQMEGQEGCSLVSDQSGTNPFASLIQAESDGNCLPSWYVYCSVDDIDATCEKIKSAGGAIHEEPFAIEGVGRIALAADPDGAKFFVHAGDGVTSSTGNDAPFMWFEVITNDVDSTKEFYSKVFGWHIFSMDMGDTGEYDMFQHNNETFAGISSRSMMGEHAPPSQWIVYAASNDVDKDAEKVKHLGGQVFVDPFDVPTVGRMSLVKDAGGAIFWLFKPESVV